MLLLQLSVTYASKKGLMQFSCHAAMGAFASFVLILSLKAVGAATCAENRSLRYSSLSYLKILTS